MKGTPIDKIDPNNCSPPDEPDVKYFCKCYCSESDHDEGGACSNCGECEKYVPNLKNPEEPDEPDPDTMPGGVDDY